MPTVNTRSASRRRSPAASRREVRPAATERAVATVPGTIIHQRRQGLRPCPQEGSQSSFENESEEVDLVAFADVAFAQVLHRQGPQVLALSGQPRAHRGQGLRLLRLALSQNGDHLVTELRKG